MNNKKTMPFTLKYHPDVKKVDLPKINAKIKARLKKAIEERLTSRPQVYGKPLQRTLKGYWKLRVGDYRIIFKASGNEMLILGIIHRKDVYQHIMKRLEP